MRFREANPSVAKQKACNQCPHLPCSILSFHLTPKPETHVIHTINLVWGKDCMAVSKGP